MTSIRKTTWGWCLLGLWLLAPAAAAAAPAQLFAQGVSAFRGGDFASALRYFREARAAGLDLPALYYNLGASLYKLGRYADAEEAFRACARDPAWTPLASYNAGLAAYQRGDHAAAAAYFDRAWRLADSDEVQSLALTMLERTDFAASRRPRGTLAFNVGYNDNVTFSADNLTLQTSSRSDRFAELLASAAGRWGPTTGTLLWDASIYDLRYAQLTDNNITSIAASVGKPARLEPWQIVAAAAGDYVLRHGHPFERIASLRLTGVRDRPGGGDVQIGAELSAIDSLDDNFAALDGSRQTIAASMGQRAGGGQIRLGVALERNRRADLASAGEFFSFSPTRYSIRFIGSWPTGTAWRLEPIARYTRSRYADPDRRTGGVVATRVDTEQQLELRATRKLTADWRLGAEFSYIDNRSNFQEFSYTQRAAWIGVTRVF